LEETQNKNLNIKGLNPKLNYEIILTEDCLLLMEKIGNGNGKIAFWSTLFAITNLQMNKLKKTTILNFYDEEKNCEYQLKIKVDNILFFRDIIVKKMRSLKVKAESEKVMKGTKLYRRISEKEIKEMKINEIEKNTLELKERIEKGEINDYTVNTFSTLVGKAIEYFESMGNDKYIEYMGMMKTVLNNEKVIEFTINDEKERKESDKEM
jgi:hypothetical protein